MDSAKSLEENLDDFNVITIGLANIDKDISNENQEIILLNSLPDSHKDLKTAIKYGRKSLSLEDVLGTLRSRYLEIKKDKKATSSGGEGLQVRGKPEKRHQSRGRKILGVNLEEKENKPALYVGFAIKNFMFEETALQGRKVKTTPLKNLMFLMSLRDMTVEKD